MDVLSEGLDYGYPGRLYAESLLDLLKRSSLQNETADTALRLHALWLARDPAEPRDPAEQSWLEQEVARALIRAQRGDEATAFVESTLPSDSALRREVTIAVHLEAKNFSLAREAAQAWLSENPQSVEAARLMIVACRNLGDYAAMDAHLIELRNLLPPGPEAFLTAITNQHLAGRFAARDAALEDLLFRHGSSPGTYKNASFVFSEISFAEGLDRLETEARLQGLPIRSLHWSRLILAQKQGKWPQVLQQIEAMETSPGPPPSPAEKAWLLTMKRLAAACLEKGTGSDVALIASISGQPLSHSTYQGVLTALLAAEKAEAAIAILTLAEGPFPRSPDLQTLRIQATAMIEIQRAAALAARPEPTRRMTASFADFSAEFTRLLKDQGPIEALAHLDAARRAAPDWFATESLNIDRLELPLRARQDDPMRLQVLVRSVLARAPDEASAMLGLAHEIHPTNPDNARLLLLQMIHHKTQPDDALSLLRKWYPKEFTPAEPETS